MRIGITGATGFLGQKLTASLRAAGHDIVGIGRGAGNAVRWDPDAGTIDAARCSGIDVFIHLAGASVGERWTPAQKRAIHDSRVNSTALLARTAAALAPKPRLLICASGVGIYGDAGDAICDERAPVGHDFLAGVGAAWESAAEPARTAGIRTVHLRLGVVLSAAGGALPRMLPPFKLGVGGRLGSGRQWMSWVSLDDVLAMVRFVLEQEGIQGAVNAVAPHPVRNSEFTDTLARVLRRPALFPVPAAALKLMFGEMAEGTLLVSQRAVPARLLSAGFEFRHPTLESALRAAL